MRDVSEAADNRSCSLLEITPMTNEERIIELLTEIRDAQRALLEEYRAAVVKAADRDEERKHAIAEQQREWKHTIEEQRRITNQQKADSVTKSLEVQTKLIRLDSRVAIALLVLGIISAAGSVIFVLTHF